MISRLPKWIEYGAFVLALVAGCINAIGLLGFEHQSVSHLSGTATLLGTSVLEHPASISLQLAGVLFSFFLGASLSGYLLHGSTIRLGQHYDTALVLEALLIFGAYWLLSRGSFVGMFAASAACGIQNAMATHYSGAVVRTTHLTGIFTDLGIMLGAFLRGEGFDRRKALLFLIIITGFVAGGTIGALLFAALAFRSLLVPGTVCLVLAGGYRFYSVRYGQ